MPRHFLTGAEFNGDELEALLARAVDLSPLRESVAFRRLWIGYVVNQVGSQLTVVAIAFQVFQVTGSSLDVGLISLAQLIPGFVAPLAASALGDMFDRRTLLFLTNAGGLLCSLGLALNAQLHLGALWPLFVFAAGLGLLLRRGQPDTDRTADHGRRAP